MLNMKLVNFGLGGCKDPTPSWLEHTPDGRMSLQALVAESQLRDAPLVNSRGRLSHQSRFLQYSQIRDGTWHLVHSRNCHISNQSQLHFLKFT